jgi:hypothetical protein
MLGPRRFTDLLDGLPGIGRNLLAERLRRLESEDIVRRGTLPPPGAARVYELTSEGRALAPALSELGRWGARRIGQPRPSQTFRPAWAMFPLSYMADREAAAGVRETYEFRVGDDTFVLEVDDGRVSPRVGTSSHPDLVLTMSGETLLDLLGEQLDPVAALQSGQVEFDGEPAALANCLAIVGGRAETPAAATATG